MRPYLIVIFWYATLVSRVIADPLPNLGKLLVNIVNPISGIKILPLDKSINGKPGAYARIVGCRNEYEPVSFVITPIGSDANDVLVKASDLSSKTSAIPASDIDVKLVKVWYQADTAWQDIRIKTRQPVLVPELMLNDDRIVKVDTDNKINSLLLGDPKSAHYIDISAPGVLKDSQKPSIDSFPVTDATHLQPVSIKQSQNQQFWVTVHIPHDARPDDYSGKLDVFINGNNIGYITLSVTVLPFKLEPPKLEYSIYYRSILSDKATVSSEEKNESQFHAELVDLIKHGVHNPSVYQPYEDSKLLDRVLAIRSSLGIKGALYYLGVSTGNPQSPYLVKQYVDRVSALKSKKNLYGITDVYVYGIDEASGDILTSQFMAWDKIRSVGGKIFAANWKSGYFEVAGNKLDLVVDGQHINHYEANKYHEIGKKIFLYNNPQAGVENPFVYRMNYGLKVWQANYDGVMTYAYQTSMGSTWNDFDHAQFRDHVFAYPTTTGVIDTIAWEGFREAVDDVRYLSTLETAIMEAKQKRRSTALMKSAQDTISFAKNYNGDDLNMLRSRVIGSILSLSQ